MKNLTLPLFIVFLSGYTYLNAQVYPAGQGSFIVFHEQATKHSTVTLDNSRETYKWPSSKNDFMSRYRIAEKKFPPSIALTDDDLIKIWDTLESMESLAYSFQYSPAMLIALGQATYIDAQPARITLTKDGKESLLQTRNHITDANTGTTIASVQDKGLSIQIKILYPANSWVNNAMVYKTVVGSKDSFRIHPIILTTQLPDRIEMHIRDTSKIIGEFLYTIHPGDQLGNTHPSLKRFYGQNYNSTSAPVVFNFNVSVADQTKAVRLSWQTDIQERVRAFEIYRSQNVDGPFVKIATVPGSDTAYTDHVHGVMRNYYYYVQLLDQTNAGMRSHTRFVTPQLHEKPQPPVDPLAESVAEGVRISWTMHDELNLIRGYYVYRKSKNDDNWKQVSAFIPKGNNLTMYIDTTSSLQSDQEYQYAVRSESTSYILSDMSSVVNGRPGGFKHSLLPATLQWRYLDDGSLMLFWENIPAQQNTISGYRIFQTDAEGNPQNELTMALIDSEQHHWTIQSPASAAGYCLKSEDIWGNQSVCSPMVNPLQQSKLMSAGPLLATPGDNGYRITWGKAPDGEYTSIIVYEHFEDQKKNKLATLPVNKTNYIVPGQKGENTRIISVVFTSENGKKIETDRIIIGL